MYVDVCCAVVVFLCLYQWAMHNVFLPSEFRTGPTVIFQYTFVLCLQVFAYILFSKMTMPVKLPPPSTTGYSCGGHACPTPSLATLLYIAMHGCELHMEENISWPSLVMSWPTWDGQGRWTEKKPRHWTSSYLSLTEKWPLTVHVANLPLVATINPIMTRDTPWC